MKAIIYESGAVAVMSKTPILDKAMQSMIDGKIIVPKSGVKTLAPWGDEPRNFGYVLIHRAKKSQPWREVARFASNGRCCQANAEFHCETEMGWADGYIWGQSAYRLVSSDDWAKRQAKQLCKGL